MFESKKSLKGSIELLESQHRHDMKRIATANLQVDQMSDRLHEHQTTAQIAIEAMEEQLGEFLETLHNTMGGAIKPRNEAEALDRLRVLRAHADRYQAIRDVMAGTFDPNIELLKRIACAVGCSQFDSDTVIERAGQLSAVHSKNAELFRELTKAKQQIDENDPEHLHEANGKLSRTVQALRESGAIERELITSLIQSGNFDFDDRHKELYDALFQMGLMPAMRIVQPDRPD